MSEQAIEDKTFFPAPSDPDIAQLALLRLLNERPELSQRELSLALGLSLGKTHYVLHALLDRGLVKVRNFRRNDNKLAYAYLLTPAGLSEKLSLTRRFLARKKAEFEHCNPRSPRCVPRSMVKHKRPRPVHDPNPSTPSQRQHRLGQGSATRPISPPRQQFCP